MARIPTPVIPIPSGVDPASKKFATDLRSVLQRYAADVDRRIDDLERRILALETAP